MICNPIDMVSGIFIAVPYLECVDQPQLEAFSYGKKRCHRGNRIIRGHAENCGPGHGEMWKRWLHRLIWCYQRLCLPNQTARKRLYSNTIKRLSSRHYSFWCRNVYHQRARYKLRLCKNLLRCAPLRTDGHRRRRDDIDRELADAGRIRYKRRFCRR